MSIDPELFRLNRVDDAFHGRPSPDAFEWWYLDAIFDNGYSMVTSWHIGAMEKETANPEPRMIINNQIRCCYFPASYPSLNLG